MRRFIKKGLFVLLSFISILVGTGLAIEYILYRNTHELVYDYQADWHLKHSQKMEVIFLGNSRIRNQVDVPRLIQQWHVPMYALCQNARTMDFLWYKFKEYLKRNSAPKMVVVQMDPLFLMNKSMTNNTLFGKEKYLTYMFADNLGINHLINREKGFYWYETIIPLIRYSHYPDLFKKHWNKVSLDPYAPPLNYGTLLLPYKPNRRLGKLKRNRADSNFFNANLSFQYLDTLVQFCNANHIQVVGIYPPQSYVFYSQQLDSAKPKAIEEYVHQHHIPYANFNGPIYKADSLFQNHMHLNERGASLFTAQLIQFLDSLKTRNYW